MNPKPARYAAVALLCACFGMKSTSAFSEPAPKNGTIAGRVFDKATNTGLAGVKVSAQLISTNERFSGLETDDRGSYVISPVPPGVYAFYLDYRGVEYSVDNHLDVRTSMSFLLETCFQVDRTTETVSLLQECRSGFYAEAQVVTIGPHRFLRPEPDPTGQQAAPADLDLVSAPLAVQHEGLDCFAKDRFPVLDANIQPTERVQSGRVYFRAAQYPDFYYVEMVQNDYGFEAVLPKPSPETEEVIYYVEAVDLDFNNAQTPEYAPEVTEDDSCRRRRPAAAYFPGADPQIVVGATVAGAPAVPAGFEAVGITGFISATGVATGAVAAAGAGAGASAIGTTGVIIVASGAAAGAGAVVVATGESEASPIK